MIFNLLIFLGTLISIIIIGFIAYYRYEKKCTLYCFESLIKIGAITNQYNYKDYQKYRYGVTPKILIKTIEENISSLRFKSNDHLNIFALYKFCKFMMKNEKLMFVYFEYYRNYSRSHFYIGESDKFNTDVLLNSYSTYIEKNIDSDYIKLLELWKSENIHLFEKIDKVQAKNNNFINTINNKRESYRKNLLGRVQQPNSIKKD